MANPKPDDALEQSPALKRLLTNLAQNYYEGEDGPVEVRWTDRTAHASTDPDGTPVVHVNVDAPWDIYEATGAHALRLLVDTLSHEVQHHNDSEIEGKGDFMEQFNDGYAKLAGMVINVLEDNHIDYNRHRKYRGLKSVHDWQIQTQMSNDERRPPMGELDPRDQAVQGFIQLAFSGSVKGLSDADPEVREALLDVAPKCEQVKQARSPEARKEMAAEVVERLTEVIPKRPDLPDWLKDLIRDLMEDMERSHFDPDDAPEDSEFDPEDAEQEEAGTGDGGDGEDDAGQQDDDPTSSGGSGGSGDETGEEGEDGSGGGAGDEDGDGEGGRTQREGDNRTVIELTGGQEDASNIRVTK
ncbi:hypothetical protein M197_gp02 [Haloarcula hispanica tailed virus 2]|uniref:Uncharacterized protein n=1 Tax=Haloarcula hispanica tailed virus 2 TaxID=1273751 RepID=R4T663_9CAUD|nr:hypothetical protein M197_gp02 [Haloarcula hispanica tailed virus 2]AGM11169.1 hypothetical protein HHTV2_2 [Haloarcula hispanica tailed virus 2]